METNLVTGLLGKIAEFFQNASIPFEMMDVYTAITSIWSAFPFVIRVCLVGCFSLACLFAILKMLF